MGSHYVAQAGLKLLGSSDPPSQLLGRLRQENGVNPGGRHRAEIAPLHSSLGDRARLQLQKNKNKNKNETPRVLFPQAVLNLPRWGVPHRAPAPQTGRPTHNTPSCSHLDAGALPLWASFFPAEKWAWSNHRVQVLCPGLGTRQLTLSWGSPQTGPGQSQKAPEGSSSAGVPIRKEAPGGRLRSHHSQPGFSEQKRSQAPAAGAGQSKGPEHACPGHVDAVPTVRHGPACSPSPKTAAGRKGPRPTSHPGVERKGPPWWAQGPGSLGHIRQELLPDPRPRAGQELPLPWAAASEESLKAVPAPGTPHPPGSRWRWAGAARDRQQGPRRTPSPPYRSQRRNLGNRNGQGWKRSHRSCTPSDAIPVLWAGNLRPRGQGHRRICAHWRGWALSHQVALKQ
ncbi:uncharacterized protein LOC144336944 isoform X2 [Macaca mulatta]